MLRQLALTASFILLTQSLVSAQTAKFQIEEATIEDIQAAPAAPAFQLSDNRNNDSSEELKHIMADGVWR